MDLKTVFVVNPTSSSGRTQKRFAKLLPSIRTHFSEARVEYTQTPLHATELTRAALKDGADLLVAVGGDGTVNEVLNGFFENEMPINASARLGILMSGTGGDFRRSIGVPSNLEQALVQVKNGKSSRVDVGVVKATQQDGSQQCRYFLNASSIGLSAMAALLVKEQAVRPGRLEYIVAALRALKRSPPTPVTMTVDNETKTIDDLSLMTFANAAYFGGAMHIAPGASLTDGLADVVCIRKVGFWTMICHGLSLYRGTHLTLKISSHLRAQTLSAEGKMLVEADGEPCGQLPATFAILPGAIQLQGIQIE